MRLLSIMLFIAAAISGLEAKPLKVATLHPLLADLSREVGGDRVEVVELVGPNDNPHDFEPTPRQIQSIGEANLCLASGMGLENYLDTLRELLPKNTQLIELGADLPSIEGGACEICEHGHKGHDHDNHKGHDHAGHDHTIDPHWWHSIDTFRRAVSLTADHFAKADPEGAATYRTNATAYRARLDQLEKWTKREVVKIPRDRRILATAHAAFGYFCHDFGFDAIPVQGMNREQMPDAATLAKLIKTLRDRDVPAIFPEKASNPKILQALTADTGIRLADPLHADGTQVKSYESMIRENVTHIVAALAE